MSGSAILSEPDTSYDVLVQVMDAVRSAKVTQGKASSQLDLFPNISVGDASPMGRNNAAADVLGRGK